VATLFEQYAGRASLIARPFDQALIAHMRGQGTVVERNHLGTVLRDLQGMGYTFGTSYAFSRGGIVAINEMGNFSCMTFDFVGLDVVRLGRGTIDLPPNVVSASNYYQQNPYSFWRGNTGNSFRGTPLSSATINVRNVHFTGSANVGGTGETSNMRSELASSRQLVVIIDRRCAFCAL